MRFLLPALLPLVLATPAAAQTDDLTALDHFAAVMIGFAGGETALVAGGEGAQITRDGPGKFSGKTEGSGKALTFEIVETSPCVFDAAFTMEGDEGPLKLFVEATKIKAFAFEQGDSQFGYTFFTVLLEVSEGAIMAAGPDGAKRDAGNRSNIGSSLTLDELKAAGAALQAACPPA